MWYVVTAQKRHINHTKYFRFPTEEKKEEEEERFRVTFRRSTVHKELM